MESSEIKSQETVRQPEAGSFSDANLMELHQKAREENIASQIKFINSVKVFNSEESALGLTEGSWSKIKEAYQTYEVYPDKKTDDCACKIKNNFPGKYELRFVQYSGKMCFARRHKVETLNSDTEITEIIDVPEGRGDLAARFIAIVARNGERVINLMDFVGQDEKDDSYLKFKAALSPSPALLRTILGASQDEGSRVDSENKNLVIDESVEKRYFKKEANNNMDRLDVIIATYFHEAGHTTQNIFRDFVENTMPTLKKYSSKARHWFWGESKKYFEKNAWAYEMLAIRKCAQLGVPVISKNTNFDDRFKIADGSLKVNELDTEYFGRKKSFCRETTKFFKELGRLFEIE